MRHQTRTSCRQLNTPTLHSASCAPRSCRAFPLPTEVAGIDPALEWMAHDEVVETGMLGKALVEGLYEPQAKYTDEELRRILYGSEPRYLYESPKGDGGNVPTIDGSHASLNDIRYLLRDPHSPVLHPDSMRGIAVYNIPLYQDVVTFYERNPQYMPDDLEFSEREAWTEAHKKQVRLGWSEWYGDAGQQ